MLHGAIMSRAITHHLVLCCAACHRACLLPCRVQFSWRRAGLSDFIESKSAASHLPSRRWLFNGDTIAYDVVMIIIIVALTFHVVAIPWWQLTRRQRRDSKVNMIDAIRIKIMIDTRASGIKLLNLMPDAIWHGQRIKSTWRDTSSPQFQRVPAAHHHQTFYRHA